MANDSKNYEKEGHPKMDRKGSLEKWVAALPGSEVYGCLMLRKETKQGSPASGIATAEG